ncbi:MAG TPA: hypothetical protein VF469_01950 [Kofleriaceae bacterium]
MVSSDHIDPGGELLEQGRAAARQRLEHAERVAGGQRRVAQKPARLERCTEHVHGGRLGRSA